MNSIPEITEGQILTGVMFNEPMRVVTTRQGGAAAVIAGLVGQNSGQFREVTLSQDDIACLNTIDPNASYDGDGDLLKMALDAYTLGIAHEFDPYFGLSISRVDPLPHQLEAVYEYFMKLPSVRFLLADDAGAGKTIMAGLLIRELKLRGLVERILIVCPANPDLPVATGTAGGVRPTVRRDERVRHPQPVRNEPVAGAAPGRHIPGPGQASGHPPRAGAGPLGLGDHRRGPPDVRQRVNGSGKVDHMGGSIVGLRLSLSSEKVLTNWPAKMSYSPHGECDFDFERTGKTSGSERFAR